MCRTSPTLIAGSFRPLGRWWGKPRQAELDVKATNCNPLLWTSDVTPSRLSSPTNALFSSQQYQAELIHTLSQWLFTSFIECVISRSIVSKSKDKNYKCKGWLWMNLQMRMAYGDLFLMLLLGIPNKHPPPLPSLIFSPCSN